MASIVTIEVTNPESDIEVIEVSLPVGQGVPTGGTVDQVLAKLSSGDYDTAWVDPTVAVGTGDVVGPAGATDGRPALFDGATGKLLKQASGALGTAAFTASSAYEVAGAAAAAQAASQPLDSDLTAIALLTTTAYGRALLALADAAAGRTAFGLGTAATSAASAFEVAGAAAAAQAASQPLDSDLTAIAALTTTSFGRAFLALADAAAARTAVGLNNVDNTSNATERTATATLGGKRITPRISTITSNATWAPNADTDDVYTVTAQAAAATTISNPSGTPTDGQRLIIRVKDNATARGLTWSGTQWRASSDLALPTTTIISKTMYLGFIYNSADTKWDFVAFLNNF